MRLEDPIKTVKGIGAEREKIFRKLGIETAEDLLNYYPRDYEDRTKAVLISELKEDENSVILAASKETAKTAYVRGMAITQVRVYDASGSITVVWYNQPYAKKYNKARHYVCNYRKAYGQKRQKADYIARCGKNS